MSKITTFVKNIRSSVKIYEQKLKNDIPERAQYTKNVFESNSSTKGYKTSLYSKEKQCLYLQKGQNNTI